VKTTDVTGDVTGTAGSWSSIDRVPADVKADGRDVLVAVLPGGRQLVAHYKPAIAGWVASDDQRQIFPTHYQELGPGPPASPPAAPVLTSLDPATAALGDPDFTLRVHGTGFAAGAVIVWNGAPEPTTVVSPTEVTTGVDMSTAEVALPIPVLVQNSDGAPSNVLTFALTDGPPSGRTPRTPRTR
jgi:hypothetical protein